ncbi:MAG TPA: DUF3786 domain-containing protein [Syntrophorhabdales bacterium]|nr:DUF3786 domain-containing protein [Syntrophorhabdales bacterium]
MALQKQKTYKKVFDLTCEELRNSDLAERLQRASFAYKVEDGQYVVESPFFEETIVLEIPRFSFRSEQGSNVTLATKILILHYLLKASGKPLGQDRIPYEDIPGCRPYLPVFERRVVRPLVSAFGFDRNLFRSAGEALRGTPESYGDVSFTLHALPMIPFTFILWEADEEFPASVKVLFDPSIDTYLPLEDITVLSKLAVVRIIKAARKGYQEEDGV